jgi:hypothetical protein
MYIIRFFNIYYNVGTAYDLNGANTGNLASGCIYTSSEFRVKMGKTTKR